MRTLAAPVVVDPLVQLRAEFDALRQEMAELRAHVDAQQAPGRAIVRQGDQRLLDALRARIQGGIAFTAHEVLRHADVDSALAEALASAGLCSVSKIGRRLSRLGRHRALERVGKDERGAIWCLPDARHSHI